MVNPAFAPPTPLDYKPKSAGAHYTLYKCPNDPPGPPKNTMLTSEWNAGGSETACTTVGDLGKYVADNNQYKTYSKNK